MFKKSVHDLGCLEVAIGCMYAGKTSTLIKRYKNIQPFRPIVAFKPAKDNRYSKTDIVAHDTEKNCPTDCENVNNGHCHLSEHWQRKKIPATAFQHLKEIDQYLQENKKVKDLIIDELHFLPEDTHQWFKKWIEQGVNIYCAGLNWNYFANQPFPTTVNCLALATYIETKTAECEYRNLGYEQYGEPECNLPAVRTMWRLSKLPETPADFVGGKEKYMSVCLKHYQPLTSPLIKSRKETEKRTGIEEFFKKKGTKAESKQPKLTLTEIKDIVIKREFGRFYRDKKTDDLYLRQKKQALSELNKELELVKKRGERWCLRKNDYPYCFEDDLEHWILWDTKGSWEEMEWEWNNKKRQQLTFRDRLVDWINPPQYRSVDIPHVHLVFKK